MTEPIATTRTLCRICPQAHDKGHVPTGETLIPILSLGNTPLADKFVTDPKAEEASAPLDVAVCSRCKLVQLTEIVHDDLLFGSDYAFYTGASPSSIPYFKEYAKEVMERFPEQCNGLIVEIASNDGTLLKHFKDAGHDVLGVEPTANTAQEAIDNGVPTLIKPFGTNTAFYWQKLTGKDKASLIIGNNVLAHVDTLGDFLHGCLLLLEDDGVLIFEVQYLPHLLFNNAFDHIYHEHRSFFSVTSLMQALYPWNLHIFDIQEADTQGGSIRVFIRKDPWGREAPPPVVQSFLDRERDLGLTELDVYKSFAYHAGYTQTKLMAILHQLKAQGKTIYGFGASAKGNTLLNSCQIGPEILDCIVDTTPYKVGKYSPGMHIPVVAPHDRPEPDYYLVLVWNYLSGILTREEAFRANGGHFIVPIPTPIII